jgi:prephenate dehydrogenase
LSARIAILGIGLIGGSLAYALQGKCDRLIGVDSDPDVAAAAERLGIFDAVSVDPAPVLGLANFLILSAPVAQILSLIERLPTIHPGATAVLDTGSTKVEIVRAMRSLPSRFFPVGGHPMAGKEVGGLDSAEGSLFQGAPFALVRVRYADPDPIDLA